MRPKSKFRYVNRIPTDASACDEIAGCSFGHNRGELDVDLTF